MRAILMVFLTMFIVEAKADLVCVDQVVIKEEANGVISLIATLPTGVEQGIGLSTSSTQSLVNKSEDEIVLSIARLANSSPAIQFCFDFHLPQTDTFAIRHIHAN